MAVSHIQRMRRVLIKIAEDPNATIQQKLDAGRQLSELIDKKPARTRVRNKPVQGSSNLLG